MNTNFEYFVIFLNDKNKRLYENQVFVISKIELIKLNGTPDTLRQRKQLYITPPHSRIKKHWSSYWVNINDLDKI